MASDSPNPRAGRPQGGRYTPRLDTLGQLQVRILTQPAPATVREISLGGFSIETTVPFSSGTTHRFRFALDEGPSVVTIAECIHSARASRQSSVALFLSGFEFVPVNETTSESIASLVYRIAEIWDLAE
ncbi:MAG: PilZ domain-containing protein [Vicinamibacterales bacterium]